ncbi:MAG: HAD family hydrolase [Candidatus Woesearchaeota archaeon]
MFWFSKKEVKLICFDMDDTLCDSKPAETDAEVYLLEMVAKDIKKMQSENKRLGKKRLAGMGSCSAFALMSIFNDVKKSHLHTDPDPESFSRARWLRETFERVDADYDLGISINTLIKDADIYERKYWDCFNKKVKLYPNTLSTLEYLRSKKLKLAMLTDSDGKKGFKAERISNMDLGKYFDYILITDDTGKNKPSVENWEILLKSADLKANQCMMVGDHPNVDLVSAKKLGFITVWTKESLKNDAHIDYVDYEISDIKEVTSIVDKINGK